MTSPTYILKRVTLLFIRVERSAKFLGRELRNHLSEKWIVPAKDHAALLTNKQVDFFEKQWMLRLKQIPLFVDPDSQQEIGSFRIRFGLLWPRSIVGFYHTKADQRLERKQSYRITSGSHSEKAERQQIFIALFLMQAWPIGAFLNWILYIRAKRKIKALRDLKPVPTIKDVHIDPVESKPSVLPDDIQEYIRTLKNSESVQNTHIVCTPTSTTHLFSFSEIEMHFPDVQKELIRILTELAWVDADENLSKRTALRG